MDAQMFRSAGRNNLLCGLFVAMTCGAVTAASGDQETGTRTAGAQREQRGVLAEVQNLLRAGVQVGLALGAGDFVEMDVVGPPRTTRQPGGQIAPEEAVQSFSQRWGHLFTLTQSDGVFNVISPRARLCAAGLNRVITRQTTVGSPLEVLFAFARTFDESLQRLPPPGIVHGGPGGNPREADGSFTQLVTVNVEEGRLQLALEQLVRNSPGLGWFAAERCDASGACLCQLGLISATGVLRTSYDAAAGIPRQSPDRGARGRVR